MRTGNLNHRTRNLITAAVAAAGVAVGGSALAQDITVTSYGGIWETAIKECYADEFEKRTGHKADVLIGSPAQWMSQIEANPENPPVHVLVSTEPNTIAAGDKGLIEKPTEADLEHLADVPQIFKDAVDGYGACFDYGAFIIAYNKNTVKNPPKSIKEFVDRTIAGEWVATLPSISYAISTTVVIWGFADTYGGGVDDIQPAIDVVNRMKDSGNLISWSSVTDFLNQMSTGEADIGMYWDGRAWAFIDKGNDWMEVVVPEDKAVMTCVAMNKVKNAPDSVWEYLNIVYEPGPMSCFSNHLQYGVTNRNVTYSDKMKSRITPWEETRHAPPRAVGQKAAEWIERWNKEVGF